MDYDYKPSYLVIQPRRTRPGKEETGLLTNGPQSKEERPKFTGTELESLQRNYAAAMSPMNPPEVSEPLTASKNTQLFAFGPLNCTSCRRSNLEADEDFTSRFFSAGPADISVVDSVTFRSSLSYPAGHQSDTDGETSFNILPCCSVVSGGTPSPLRQQMPQSAEVVESFVDSTAVLAEVSDLILSLASRSSSDRASGLEEEVVVNCCLLYLNSFCWHLFVFLLSIHGPSSLGWQLLGFVMCLCVPPSASSICRLHNLNKT